jgi:hypothetical protein
VGHPAENENATVACGGLSKVAHKYIDHPVHDRLYFADRRLNDLRSLNNGDFGVPRERQPLLQEFFFHLCGAIDFLAQEVNNLRKLGLKQEEVSVSKVNQKLAGVNPKDPIISVFTRLHPATRKKPLPADPYSDEGSHFRIIIFRNFVSHIRHNPLNFRIGGPRDPSVHLFLDPRLPHVPKDQRTPSNREAFEELALFLDLVMSKCNLVLKELGIPVP